MRSVEVESFGDREHLLVKEVPRPTLLPNQVLVEVFSSSVNPIDWKLRQGILRYAPGFGVPFSLGFDFAGIIQDVGKDVDEFFPGDAVFGKADSKTGGAYSEFLAVGQDAVAIKPKNLSFDEAAGFPLAGLTAYQALVKIGGLRVGSSVLVNGASGGVGLVAVQIAKALGAQVTGVCSGKNINLVQSLGADRVIDYQTQDIFVKEEQYDIILDAVGSLSIWTAKDYLGENGVFVSTLPNMDVIAGYMASSVFRSKKVCFVSCKSSGDDLRILTPFLESGQIKVVIDSKYDLKDVKSAHQRSESQRAAGKIILKVH